MTQPSLDEILECALGGAREAGEVALRYFQKDLQVEWKADRTPVTVADRECEQLLRRKIEEHFPEHGILGEEFGATRPEAAFRWTLDPIDGTQSFIRGVPIWGVMVGVEHDREPVAGVVHFPALGETLWARKEDGAWWNGRRAQVSSVSRMEDATLLLTDVRGFTPAGFEQAFEQLRKQAKFERTWGDCYGHALVATGRAEIMLDPLLSEWDACALFPILSEAGGRFTDWKGQATIRGGNGLSTNAALHDTVMKIVRGVSR